MRPDYAKAYYNRSLVKERQGDDQGGALDRARALRIDPALADAAPNPYDAGDPESD